MYLPDIKKTHQTIVGSCSNLGRWSLLISILLTQIVCIQWNLIHPNSLFARVISNCNNFLLKTDFLAILCSVHKIVMLLLITHGHYKAAYEPF